MVHIISWYILYHGTYIINTVFSDTGEEKKDKPKDAEKEKKDEKKEVKKEEKVAEEKKVEKKDEPKFELLSNPARVIVGQYCIFLSILSILSLPQDF